MKVLNRCGYNIDLGNGIELVAHGVCEVKKTLWKEIFSQRKPIRDAVCSGHLIVIAEDKKGDK